MSSIPIHPITISTLQHVSAFGPCTLDALRTAVPGITSKTTNNLVQLGHCMRTEQGFAAYALPSRVGKHLHWPDGRVTPVEDRTAGLPA